MATRPSATDDSLDSDDESDMSSMPSSLSRYGVKKSTQWPDIFPVMLFRKYYLMALWSIMFAVDAVGLIPVGMPPTTRRYLQTEYISLKKLSSPLAHVGRLRSSEAFRHWLFVDDDRAGHHPRHHKADIVPYKCRTQPRVKTNPYGLGLDNPIANIIFRWIPGLTLFWYLDVDGLSRAAVERVRQGMKIAANMWHRTGLNLYFKETTSRAKATFTLKYDSRLPLSLYAMAFGPGSPLCDRVLRVGRLALQQKHIGYIANVLCHELGHVLGLRHDFWEERREHVTAPAVYYPTAERDSKSVMNYYGGELWRYVPSRKDSKHIRMFYNEPTGRLGSCRVKNVDPRGMWKTRRR